MIPVRVRDHDMADAFTRQPGEQRGDMRRIVRSGIDHGDLARADHISARAVKSERRGIARNNAAHARRNVLQRAIFEIEAVVEGDRHCVGCAG